MLITISAELQAPVASELVLRVEQFMAVDGCLHSGLPACTPPLSSLSFHLLLLVDYTTHTINIYKQPSDLFISTNAYTAAIQPCSSIHSTSHHM